MISLNFNKFISRLFVGFALIIFVSAIQIFAQAKNVNHYLLKQFYEHKKFFELCETVSAYKNEADPQLLFYRGIIFNVDYQPHVSANYLNQYTSISQNDDEFLIEAYAMLADDYAKTFQYGKAADVLRTIVGK